MSNILFFEQKSGKNVIMNNISQIQREYQSQGEMFADLAKLLVIESKISQKQFDIVITFNEPQTIPIGHDFAALHQYVYKRVWENADLSERQYLIQRVFGFLARISMAEEYEIIVDISYADMKSHARLQQLVDTAEAYRCLEEDEAITLKHVILLTGMEEASIRNAASRGDIKFTYDEDYPGVTFIEDGDIPIVEWITTRTGYRHPPETLSSDEGEIVRVPFAADGSYFSPSCRMRKGFQIGKRNGKGILKQRYVSDYWTALEELEKMDKLDKPYWRRPSPSSGVPGTVAGRSWGSVDRSMLEEQLGQF